MIRVRINLVQHTQSSNMTSMTQWQESPIRTFCAAEYTWRIRSWRWHSATDSTPENNAQGLGENKCIVARSNTEVSSKTRFTNLKMPIDCSLKPINISWALWETCETRDTTGHLVFEGKPPVKLHAKNIEVETNANGNPRQDQVTMGGFTVLDLLLQAVSTIHVPIYTYLISGGIRSCSTLLQAQQRHSDLGNIWYVTEKHKKNYFRISQKIWESWNKIARVSSILVITQYSWQIFTLILYGVGGPLWCPHL